MTKTKEVMRPYPDQQVAVDKLCKVPARLCGDSMGVGKTVTGIYLDFKMREERPDLRDRPTLIISEKIGLEVWRYHLVACGVPENQILVIDPLDRTKFVKELRTLQDGRRNGIHPRYRYFVCHWDVLVRIDEINEKRSNGRPKIEWAHVIADEVHLAKNRKALRTIELKRIVALYKTGLSGTPADDKPQDLWSILHWLYPDKYRSYWRFYEKYVGYDTHPFQGYRIPVGVKNVSELHREIRPFYIRRTLDEVEDMPPKIYVRPITTVRLGKAQRAAYNSMRDKALAVIGGDEFGTGKFTLLAPAVIAVWTRLQQFALATLTPEWDIPDDEWIEDEDSLEWEFPNLVLSKPSPKLDAVMNIIETHEEEPFVIFSQFKGMVDLIEEECRSKKISVVKITGDIKKESLRTKAVEDFQNGTARIFVGTIAAAGKTITLTRANHVIFTDRSWNPSKNEQAEDRVWRRTQKNAVRIIDIQAEDTIDQERFDKINHKGDLIHAFMGDKR